MSGDEITLRLPRERPFFGVAHLVLGGLAVRLDLSFDELEDLQVALTELLEQQDAEGEVSVTVRVEGDSIRAVLGPFEPRLNELLEQGDGDSVGLRRVLETVVDRVEVVKRDGGHWVELTKAVRK